MNIDDAPADGYVRSEARAVLMLGAMKGPRAAAATDDDSAAAPLAAVFVNGTAVNQDGRSSSLTAPNGPAQQAAMRLAIAECGGGGGGGGYDECGAFVTISMHGTGTSLGDPIEVGAIAAVHCKKKPGAGAGASSSSSSSQSSSSSPPPLVLEAVKSYVGHTELTAGRL